jgi:cytochrome c oxidase subunit 2
MEVISPTITIKVTASQWFWSYEYSDYITDNGDQISFDSC